MCRVVVWLGWFGVVGREAIAAGVLLDEMLRGSGIAGGDSVFDVGRSGGLDHCRPLPPKRTFECRVALESLERNFSSSMGIPAPHFHRIRGSSVCQGKGDDSSCSIGFYCSLLYPILEDATRNVSQDH